MFSIDRNKPPLGDMLVSQPEISGGKGKYERINLMMKFRRGKRGMVEYTVLIGAVTLIGILGLTVLGRKTSDTVGTLSVILPGSQTVDDLKHHQRHFIETEEGDDGAFKIDSAEIGDGDTARLNHAVGEE